MARRLAELPKGSRISDYISLGVIAKTFPADKIEAVLAATGKASVRRRALPAQVVATTSSPWLFTCSPPTARCCAACWKGCSG